MHETKQTRMDAATPGARPCYADAAETPPRPGNSALVQRTQPLYTSAAAAVRCRTTTTKELGSDGDTMQELYNNKGSAPLPTARKPAVEIIADILLYSPPPSPVQERKFQVR